MKKEKHEVDGPVKRVRNLRLYMLFSALKKLGCAKKYWKSPEVFKIALEDFEEMEKYRDYILKYSRPGKFKAYLIKE